MLVARQLPSRLRQCGAKFARRPPTWDPSTLSGWGSRRRPARLLAAVGIGSVAGSPAGAGAKGRLLCHCSLGRGGSRRSHTTEDLEAVFLDDVAFVLDLDSRCFSMNETDNPAILSACLMVLTRFWRTLGSGPSTWEPSNSAVLTVDMTWGWNPKFFNKASRHNSWDGKRPQSLLTTLRPGLPG